MIRLFIALTIPEETKKYLAYIMNDCKKQGIRISWVAAENLHLTVRFLGDTDPELILSLNGMLESVAMRYKAAECSLKMVGGFPTLKSPRVIWVGLSGQTERMSALAGSIETAVRELGLPPGTKPFKAHLTLGRVKDQSLLNAQHLEFIGKYQVEDRIVTFGELSLIQSTLSSRGSIYGTLHSVRLSN
ncbi:MAG: RNA 2',3'-cyclic phosphodiesterase [candidate division Zixibacteria bacterium]|nr:RNA 2',3'-cyclic phosphodiesterase [candidate division Zixibacteria bacterium]